MFSSDVRIAYSWNGRNIRYSVQIRSRSSDIRWRARRVAIFSIVVLCQRKQRLRILDTQRWTHVWWRWLDLVHDRHASLQSRGLRLLLRLWLFFCYHFGEFHLRKRRGFHRGLHFDRDFLLLVCLLLHQLQHGARELPLLPIPVLRVVYTQRRDTTREGVFGRERHRRRADSEVVVTRQRLQRVGEQLALLVLGRKGSFNGGCFVLKRVGLLGENGFVRHRTRGPRSRDDDVVGSV